MLHDLDNFGLQRKYTTLFPVILVTIDVEDSLNYVNSLALYQNNGFFWLQAKKRTLVHDADMINNLINSKQKKIVFVVNDLQEIGGVETRLTKLTKILKERGWIVVFFLERNDNNQLKSECNFYFNFSSKDAQENIIDLLLKIRANIVEFQFKSTKLFHDLYEIGLDELFNVGVCIHEECYFEPDKLNDVDYIVSSVKRDCLGSLKNYNVINNWQDFNFPVWHYHGQKKALIVSRIANDKLQTIMNFIDICREYEIDFEIAGNFKRRKNNIAYNKLLEYGVPADSFLGEINTLRFLSENVNHYLFVAGVGQVAIEAASLGYPTMISPHSKNARLSVFLKSENIAVLREANFTIKNEKTSAYANSTVFFKDVAQGKDLHDYITFYSMQELVGNSDVERYINIINENSSEKTRF